jgi:peptidylprolyl isomerase
MSWKACALAVPGWFRKAWVGGIVMKMHLFRSYLAACLLLSRPALADVPSVSVQVPSPGEIVAGAAEGVWVRIAAADLLVMDLAPDAEGRARRVVIQLVPAPFSQGWVGNIRKLAALHWYDGNAVLRVQDDYVVQWGDPASEDETADGKPRGVPKALPGGLAKVPQSAYAIHRGPIGARIPDGMMASRGASPFGRLPAFKDDPYAPITTFLGGFPVAADLEPDREDDWPVHCYGTVGVGRDMPPDTGSGAELYAVIGQAPRHLDRNIAVIGRVIEGVELLSSLPRGTGPLGFYEHAEERVPIVSVRMGDQVPGLPAYEYLSTESASFARYVDARANRRDAFFVRPARGVDICNVPVPVRRVK